MLQKFLIASVCLAPDTTDKRQRLQGGCPPNQGLGNQGNSQCICAFYVEGFEEQGQIGQQTRSGLPGLLSSVVRANTAMKF